MSYDIFHCIQWGYIQRV